MVTSTPLQTLKNKEFKNLLVGRFFLVLAFRMLGTLLGWWVYQLTKDPFAIALIGLSEVVPAVISAIYAGYVIDTSEKKKLLLICNAAYVFLISLLLIPAFGHGKLGFSNREITYFIYGTIFFTGIARAFLGPLIPSLIPKIVSKENLPNAITLNQGTFLTASVGGHALGGYLIGLISIKWTLVVVVSLMALGFILFQSLSKQEPEEQNEILDVRKSIYEGFQYIYKTKEIFGAQMLDMFAVLFGGAVALIPVFAVDVLQVSETKFGILNAASDIGSAIIIITLSVLPLKKNQGKILLAVVVGFGLCIIGFGLSKWYWLSFVFLMLSGMLDGISVVIRGTIVQLKTPDHLRGRVLSVNSIFIMSSNEMGQFESGTMAKLLGPVKAVVVGGSLTLLVALIVGSSNKKLRNMQY